MAYYFIVALVLCSVLPDARSEVCNEPLGMEDGRIADAQISASTYYANDPAYAAYNARLNAQSGHWAVQNINDFTQWIQVALSNSQQIDGLITQGGPGFDQWVTKYKVLYSDDGTNWNVIKDANNLDAEFNGNYDDHNEVPNMFHSPVITSFIRIQPTAEKSRSCMRFELLGCQGVIIQEEPDICYTYTTNDFGSRNVLPTDLEYPFPELPTGTTRFTLSISAQHEAYISLQPTKDGNGVGVPTVLIGLDWNQDTGYACQLGQSISNYYSTPNVLSQTEAREYYFQFDDNSLEVGLVGQPPFFSENYGCTVNLPVVAKYIGVASGYGSDAEWTYCAPAPGTPDGSDLCTVCDGLDLKLICEGTKMTVIFDASVLGYDNPSDVHFSDPSCTASEYGTDQATITTGYSTCDTNHREGVNNNILFTNKLIFGSADSPIAPTEINLECRVQNSQVVDLSFVTSFNTKTAIGTFEYYMKVYESNDFSTPYPADIPAQVKIGDTIFIEVGVVNVNALGVYLDKCYATPSSESSDDDMEKQYFIENGCEDQSEQLLVKILESGDPSVKRFSFTAFTFTEQSIQAGQDPGHVYIHCETRVCADPTNEASICNGGCDSSPARKRRSLTDLHTISSGPIVVRG